MLPQEYIAMIEGCCGQFDQQLGALRGGLG
jgi:hypothetical protein